MVITGGFWLVIIFAVLLVIVMIADMIRNR